jgi:hypothetical protein
MQIISLLELIAIFTIGILVYALIKTLLKK